MRSTQQRISPVRTKTWAYTRDGIELRCYMSSPTVGALSKDAKAVSREMGAVTGTAPVPKDLRLGDNRHGGYLYSNFDMPREAIETLRPRLKEMGWTEGKSVW